MISDDDTALFLAASKYDTLASEVIKAGNDNGLAAELLQLAYAYAETERRFRRLIMHGKI